MIVTWHDLRAKAKELDELIAMFAKMEWTEKPTLNELMAIDQMKSDYGKMFRVANESFANNSNVHYKTYDKTLLVTPGNGYLSTIEAICFQLMLYPSEMMIVLSSRDTFGKAFVDFLQAQKLDTNLRVYHTQSHEDKLYFGGKYEPEMAVVYGSTETCWTWKHRITDENTGCVVVMYGSKTSIGYDQEPDTLMSRVAQYAEDFFSYDGTGCLNTSALYVKVSDDDGIHDKHIEQVTEFARELDRLRSHYITHLQGWDTHQSILDTLMTSDKEFKNYNGIFVREPIRAPVLSGGHGTGMIVLVTGITDVEWEWQGYEDDLSSCTVYPPTIASGKTIYTRLFELGVSRICRPGKAQRPTEKWRHDGHPLISQDMYQEATLDW